MLTSNEVKEMKKILFLIIILLITVNCFAKDFNEYEFMKRVNPNITQRTMRIIKNEVDKHYPMVSHIVSKQQVYLIMAQESRFNQGATSPNRLDRGLFQVNRNTYLHLVNSQKLPSNNWTHIYDIKYNIKVGFKIIRMKGYKVKNMFNPKTPKEWAYMTLIAYNKGAKNLKNDLKRGRRDFHNFKYILALKRFIQSS